MRSVISVLAVAIEVIMILSIVAIFMGMLEARRSAPTALAPICMLMPSNASMFNGLGSPSMPIRDQEVLVKLPHVAVVSPAIQKISTSGNVEILYGIDYDSFDALKPFSVSLWRQIPGTERRHHRRCSRRRPEIRQQANPTQWATPSRFSDQPFRISGIVDQGKGGRKLIPLDTMGAADGSRWQGLDVLHQVRQPGQ